MFSNTLPTKIISIVQFRILLEILFIQKTKKKILIYRGSPTMGNGEMNEILIPLIEQYQIIPHIKI